jgi:hypothetical protein
MALTALCHDGGFSGLVTIDDFWALQYAPVISALGRIHLKATPAGKAGKRIPVGLPGKVATFC